MWSNPKDFDDIPDFRWDSERDKTNPSIHITPRRVDVKVEEFYIPPKVVNVLNAVDVEGLPFPRRLMPTQLELLLDDVKDAEEA